MFWLLELRSLWSTVLEAGLCQGLCTHHSCIPHSHTSNTLEDILDHDPLTFGYLCHMNYKLKISTDKRELGGSLSIAINHCTPWLSLTSDFSLHWTKVQSPYVAFKAPHDFGPAYLPTITSFYLLLTHSLSLLQGCLFHFPDGTWPFLLHDLPSPRSFHG